MNGSANAFFDAIANRYDRTYAIGPVESRRRMSAVLAALPAPLAIILDLGVGTGRELSALLDAGHLVTGLDVSSAMLERCARRSRPVPLVLADLWRPLPFEAAAFDACIALHGTLAHPPDAGALGRLSQELTRVVRPGGLWFCEVPSPAWLDLAGTIETGGVGHARRVRRTGLRTCVLSDTASGACIEARLFSQAEWRAALEPHWSVQIEAIDDVEWRVIARRV
jgi:SAM-dependent methyltransferase